MHDQRVRELGLTNGWSALSICGGGTGMDQDVNKDDLQQIRELLGDVLKLQELILHRLEKLEQAVDRQR